MKWLHPPIIKIYEAIGAVADGRVEVSGNTAKVYSSSGNKFYNVNYDPESRSIMANDNGSYWNGDLGYPSIALLMKLELLDYNQTIGELLKNIQWKDINQKFKNNFDKVLDYILSSKLEAERREVGAFVAKLDQEIRAMELNTLGTKMVPPKGY